MRLHPPIEDGSGAIDYTSEYLLSFADWAYGAKIGLDIAPHDLRRTFARLAHKGRAGLEQIQLALGHVSLTTTERYLGVRLDLQDGACDHLGIRVALGHDAQPGCSA